MSEKLGQSNPSPIIEYAQGNNPEIEERSSAWSRGRDFLADLRGKLGEKNVKLANLGFMALEYHAGIKAIDFAANSYMDNNYAGVAGGVMIAILSLSDSFRRSINIVYKDDEGKD
jgi:hypothetical protein